MKVIYICKFGNPEQKTSICNYYWVGCRAKIWRGFFRIVSVQLIECTSGFGRFMSTGKKHHTK